MHEPSMMLVRLIYLDVEGREDLDKQYDVFCTAIPRVGEHFVPDAGETAIVDRVYHKAVEMPGLHLPLLATTVILRMERTGV